MLYSWTPLSGRHYYDEIDQVKESLNLVSTGTKQYQISISTKKVKDFSGHRLKKLLGQTNTESSTQLTTFVRFHSDDQIFAFEEISENPVISGALSIENEYTNSMHLLNRSTVNANMSIFDLRDGDVLVGVGALENDITVMKCLIEVCIRIGSIDDSVEDDCMLQLVLDLIPQTNCQSVVIMETSESTINDESKQDKSIIKDINTIFRAKQWCQAAFGSI